jgi:hypothetical protein
MGSYNSFWMEVQHNTVGLMQLPRLHTVLGMSEDGHLEEFIYRK